jgi:uncharacterized membrane protein
MSTVLIYFFYLATPALIIFLARRIDHISKLGTIVVAYAVGLLLGNIGVLPDGVDQIQNVLTSATVPLALPLLFFSLRLSRWKELAGRGALSFVAALLSVTITSVGLHLLFPEMLGEEAWKAGGMLVGVYTGGTPNLAAVGKALDVSAVTLVSVQGADVIVGAVLLLLLVSVAPRLIGRVLPPFTSAGSDAAAEDGFSPYFTGWSRGEIRDTLIAALLAIAIVAVSAVFLLFLPEAAGLPAVMLAITTLGVAASFVKPIRRLRNSFQLGYYLILVFSITVSSMANVRDLAVTAPSVVAYVAILLGTVSLLHLAFSALFRVDRDTHIVTATSFIYSPPFVPVIAAALGNREVVVPGIVIGVTGWIAGNYLGLAVAYGLRALG